MRATVAGKRRIAWRHSLAAGALATGAAALLLALGCAPSAKLAPGITPPALRKLPAPGYDGRRDSLDSVDSMALRGKRIALDPGHGGAFTGTTGVHGLTEKEVNLGVAL